MDQALPTQTIEEKAEAIASVLFLLEAHYTMIKAGRIGSCIKYERTPDPEKTNWRPPVIEEFEDWPVERIRAWFAYQRRVSARYRLWPIGIALRKLEIEHPNWAFAVKALHVEIPPATYYEPDHAEEWARQGLLFMAHDVPGDVHPYNPAFMPANPRQSVRGRIDEVRDLRKEINPRTGKRWSYREIARRVNMSFRDIKTILRTRTNGSPGSG